MKITIVVVFYRQAIEDSKTFQTLKETMLVKDTSRHIQLILYDNSPEKQDFDRQRYTSANIAYVHDERNLGIAAAYNYAWSIAKENGSEGLLLFDHDTKVSAEYVDQVLNLQQFEKTVAAIVPKIQYGKTMISPVYSQTLRPLLADKPTTGLQEQPVMAINSGTLVRIHFLNEIGGFNNHFPLDYLDHWLFFEIYSRGYKVWVLPVSLEHDLSVMDYSGVSLKRYQSILDSEMKFYKNYKKDLYRSYRKQLAKRFLKQALVVKNKKIALYTLRRLFSM